MFRTLRVALALASLLAAAPAAAQIAQVPFVKDTTGRYVGAQAHICVDLSGAYVGCGAGGGGGGGAVTVADGADITLGAKASLAATSSVGSFDAISLLKAIVAGVQSTATSAVAIDQTTPGTTNGVQLKAGAAVIGSVSIVDAAGDSAMDGTNDAVKVNVVAGGVGGGAIFGNVASAATDSGAPVKIGGIYNTTPPTFTNGQRGDWQIGSRGMGGVTLFPRDSIFAISSTTNATDAASTGATLVGLNVSSYNMGYNGATWDRVRGNTTGLAVIPYGISASRWNYAAASGGIVNTTTAVTIKAAVASTKNCISSFGVKHDTLGAGGELVIRDGAGGTVLYRTILLTTPESFDRVLPAAVCGTANTLMEVATLTASVTGGVYFNATGNIEP